MHDTWRPILDPEFSKPYFVELTKFVDQERRSSSIFPSEKDVFNAFDVGLDCVRVVILGQDPYHGSGQAHGLSFSVLPGVPIPPSLKNIHVELASDVGVATSDHGCLVVWSKRSVMLLNTSLTVRSGAPASHSGRGWETFTDVAIRSLSDRKTPVVFILWGSHAQSKFSLIHKRHLIISSSHPSPMSARKGFFGSKPFSRANRFLAESGIGPIDWSIPANPTEEILQAPPVSEPVATIIKPSFDDI